MTLYKTESAPCLIASLSKPISVDWRHNSVTNDARASAMRRLIASLSTPMSAQWRHNSLANDARRVAFPPCLFTAPMITELLERFHPIRLNSPSGDAANVSLQWTLIWSPLQITVSISVAILSVVDSMVFDTFQSSLSRKRYCWNGIVERFYTDRCKAVELLIECTDRMLLFFALFLTMLCSTKDCYSDGWAGRNLYQL